MTVLEALAILESAVLECKKRDINTPEVNGSSGFFGATNPAHLVGPSVPTRAR